MEFYFVKITLLLFIAGCLYGVLWWKKEDKELWLLIPISLWFGISAVAVSSSLAIVAMACYWALHFTGA